MTNNPRLKARSYKCRFLEPGVVKYDKEMVLIKPENLMAIANSFKGAPITIDHVTLNDKNIHNECKGYVSSVYKGDDGWAWSELVIADNDAINKIDSGCSVSCSYIPTKFGAGGTYHNIPFAREILAGDGLHMALVDNPRYEDAMILANSINQIEKNNMTIFKFFSNKPKKEEIKEISLDNAVFEVDGEKVKVSELLKAYQNAKSKKNEKDMEEEKEKENDDEEDEMMENGKFNYKKFKNALLNEVKEMIDKDKKDNSEEDDEKEKEKEMDNEDEKKKEEEEAKNNAMNAERLKKARQKALMVPKEELAKFSYRTQAERIAAGKNHYGSK